MRILIAERKERVAAGGLLAQLETLRHELAGLARDGREAVTLAMKLRPDLILMDIWLPIMDGIEAARTILAQAPVPIILLTPYASADLIRRAREAGIMAHLVTPVEIGPLRSTIEVALARFEELQVLSREVGDLKEAFEARRRTEQAKGVLMKSLNLSEAEAFRRLQQYSRDTRRSLPEITSTIVRAEEFLFWRLSLPRRLQAILYTIRQGLS